MAGSRALKQSMKKGGSSNKWVQEAFAHNKGALHKELGVPAGKKIPEKKLEQATHSRDPLKKKRAILAETAKHFKH